MAVFIFNDTKVSLRKFVMEAKEKTVGARVSEMVLRELKLNGKLLVGHAVDPACMDPYQ